jgi:uncharacterized membrane protein
MRAVLAGLCLLAAPAAAQEVHQVTGVAPHDVLNVRRAPGASAPLAGAIPPTADFVLLHERRGAWARVEHRGTTGWVAARYLELRDIDAGPGEGVWVCYGTEPFWTLWLEDGHILYRDDLGAERVPLADVAPSRNEPGRVWLFPVPIREPFRALMQSGGLCNDGMSENHTRRHVHLVYDRGLTSGCCRRPGADERPPQIEEAR